MIYGDDIMANKSYKDYQNKKNQSKNPIKKGTVNTTQKTNEQPEKQAQHKNTKTNTQTNTDTIKLDQIKQTKSYSLNNSENTHNTSKNNENITAKSSTDTKNKNATENKNNNSKKQNDRCRHAVGLIILLGTTLLVGGVASLLGGKMRDGLIKPPAYPPEWLFPAMWCVLYIAIGIASYLAYFSVKDKKKRNDDLIFYAIHLFFNMFWAMFYFRLNMLIFATIWLAFVVISAIIVTYRYYKANYASGIIFTIYTLWLIYAMYLSLGITILNLK